MTTAAHHVMTRDLRQIRAPVTPSDLRFAIGHPRIGEAVRNGGDDRGLVDRRSR
jgi:hypothetical protein